MERLLRLPATIGCWKRTRFFVLPMQFRLGEMALSRSTCSSALRSHRLDGDGPESAEQPQETSWITGIQAIRILTRRRAHVGGHNLEPVRDLLMAAIDPSDISFAWSARPPPCAEPGDGRPHHTKSIRTAMFPRVAFEYGQVWCARSTIVCATSRGTPGRLTIRRACRK